MRKFVWIFFFFGSERNQINVFVLQRTRLLILFFSSNVCKSIRNSAPIHFFIFSFRLQIAYIRTIGTLERPAVFDSPRKSV